MTVIDSDVNRISVSVIHTDTDKGTWWAIATDKGWVEIRTTKTGQIRVFEPKKGTHPYFTPPAQSNTNEKE